MNRIAARAAAQFYAAELGLTAEQQKSAPKEVDDKFKEVKKNNPSYSDEQAWATAWSIYCKHVNPGSGHCHKSTGEYLKQAGLEKIPPSGSESRWLVTKNGQNIGLVTKARSTKSTLNPFKAYSGIGHGQKFLGSFYDEAESRKWGWNESHGTADMPFGGIHAAVAAVEHAAHNLPKVMPETGGI